MPGLVPGIRVFLRFSEKTWMAGTGERSDAVLRTAMARPWRQRG